MSVLKIVREIKEYKYVLSQMVRQYLILRYRRTVLGYMWTLVNPFLMISIMSVVFSSVFNADLERFSIFLYSGMIPWMYFSNVILQATTSITQNESIIKKVYIPKIIFPLALVVGNLVDNAFAFLMLMGFTALLGAKFGMAAFMAVPAYIILTVFVFGLSLIFSVATVYFRDIQHIAGILLQGMFFLTPIIYEKSRIEGIAEYLVQINPMVPFVTIFREPIYLNSVPDFIEYLNSIGLAFSSLMVGLIVFVKYQKKLIFRL